MDTPSRSYWNCSSCSKSNLLQLQWCTSCDTPRPRASPDRSRVPPLSPSPSQHRPASPLSVARPYSPSRHLASNFLSDLDSKNATVSRFEQHITQLSAQHHQQRRELEGELETCQRQLRQALQAHQVLMTDYQQCVSDSSIRQTEVTMLSAEVTSLREKLVGETRKRQDEIEQHSTELEAKQRLVRSLRDQIHALTEENQSWRDGSTARVSEAASTPQTLAQLIVSKEQENAALRAKVADLEMSKAEALGSVVRMTTELELEKQRVADMRSKYAEDVQGVLRDALRSNETAVEKVTQELGRAKEVGEGQWKKQLAEREEENRRLKDRISELTKHHEKEIGNANEVAHQLQSTITRLQQQRDDMLSESKFQMEIQSEFAAEKSALRAEISTLRAAIGSLDSRRPTAPSPRPSPVNTSHQGGQRLSAPGAALSDDDLQRLSAIHDSDGSNETARLIAQQRQQLVALQHEVEARERRAESLGTQVSLAQSALAAAEDRRDAALTEAGELRGKLTAKEAELGEAKRQLELAQETSQAMTSQRQNESDKTLATMEELKSEVEQAHFGQATAERQLADANRQMDRLKREIDSLEAELQEEREKSAQTGATSSKMEDELEAEVVRLSDQLKEQTAQWRSKTEALNQQVNELSSRNAELEQRAQTAIQEAKEAETALSDALANIGGDIAA